MRVRTLPGTGVTVSEVGVGAWTLAQGPAGDDDEREAVALLRAALERGVTLFDAGEGGDGRAEALLARAFAGCRERVRYAVGLAGPQAWSAEGAREAVERALARLGTDRIDVVRLHEPPARALRRSGALGAVTALVQAGRVRAWALSGAWSMLEPEAGRRLLARARGLGAPVLARDPHHGGMLEDKYTPQSTFPPRDPRARRPEGWLADGLRKVQELRALTDGRPWTPGQAAIKWLLAEPLVCAVLPDVHGPGQLEEFAAAPDLPDLTREDLARVAQLQAAWREPVSAAG